MTSDRQRRGKYSDEMRERAVLDHEEEYGSQWEAICSVAEKLGPKAGTVWLWVRRAESDSGRRPGPTSDQLVEVKRLKRENAELHWDLLTDLRSAPDTSAALVDLGLIELRRIL